MADPFWMQAGDDSWGLVVNGRAIGLVYWTEGDVEEPETGGGESGVKERGWYALLVDEPNAHYRVAEGLELTEEMTDAERVMIREDALEVASREILSRGGGR